MAIQIINNGASLKIVNSGVERLIYKSQIREIAVIKTTIVKIDIGLGVLHNIFINHPEVTSPLSVTPEGLRDSINSMLLSPPSEERQIEQTAELQAIKIGVNDLKTKMDTVNDKVFFDPLLVDESNPLTIYRGFAPVGSATSAAVWAIQRVTISGDVTIFQWADGNKNFDNVWNNRASLSYS